MTRCLLLNNGSQTLDLLDYADTGLMVTMQDYGAPAVREVVQDFPYQDGSIDYTAYLSLRVVNLQGIAGPLNAINVASGTPLSRNQAFDNLVPFLDPKARCTLTFADTDYEDVRVITNLRSSQWQRAMNNPQTYDWQVQWKADPIIVDEETTTVSVGMFSFLVVGRTYNRTFPQTYSSGGGDPANVLEITNGGTYDAWPVYRLFGPITNPLLTVADPVTTNTLSQIVFTGITVNAGDYLEVNPKLRTVYLNSNTGASRYQYVNFSVTTWKPLQVGSSILRYTGSSGAAPAQVQVTWQDSYL
jgi:hypothetical protein